MMPLNSDDADALARALIRMIDDAGLRERLRLKALERIGRFEWDASACNLIAILNEHVSLD